MNEYCQCGLIAIKDGFCRRCLKNPPKVKNEKRGEFRGRSKFAEDEGMFLGAYE